MRCRYLSLLAPIVAFVLILQISCQEQARSPDESRTTFVAAEPQIAQEEAEPPAQTDQRAPKIVFDKLEHDFGEVASEKTYSGEFKITNAGNAVLEITDVRRCCGTVAKLSKTELAPGEGAVLQVDYHSGRGPGVMNRRLYVTSNDTTNSEVELKIRARIVPKVAYEPQRLRFVLDKENAGCPDITLTSVDKQPFSITSFQSTARSVTADIDTAVEATKFVLRPKVDLEKLKNRSAGYVSIGLTHPECAKIHIYFSTLTRFGITPRPLILFNAEAQKPMTRTVSVVSNYGEDFEIVSTSSQNGLAKVLSREKTAKGYQLQVEVTPPAGDETGGVVDVLYLHVKGGEKLSINCYVPSFDREE